MENRVELLRRAKMYLDRLAVGVDPITAVEIPDDTVLNNVRISRCFYFVSGVLQEVIDNGGVVRRVAAKGAPRQSLPFFAITDEELKRVELSAEPIQIKKFCDRINDAVELGNMRSLNVTAFGKWLVEKGLLTTETIDGVKHKRATPEGEALGIVTEWRSFNDREYYATTYNIEAQRFLLDHLDEIINISNG